MLHPLTQQLKEGTSPRRMALSLSFGAALAIFPVLGATTTLCVLVGLALGLNQIALQVMNYICYPFQLILLPAFVRVGESLYHIPHMPLSLNEMKTELLHSPPVFFKHYGVSLGAGVSVWAMATPFIIITLHPVLYRLLNRHLTR